MKKLLFLFLVVATDSFAQFDTTYYVSYEDMLTTRFYFSQKYTRFQFNNLDQGVTLNYKPNTTLNMGVGASYKWFTLNLAYGFDFLNPDTGQGKTKYLDLQFHGYGRKLIMEGYGQFYRGFYLDDQRVIDAIGKPYVRPDMRVTELGLAAQYVFNYKRFTTRAPYFQNEWQKKSAGTFLLGAEVFYGQARADSTIVPRVKNTTVADTKIQLMDFWEIGPNIGYAYTLVIKQHFFITGMGSVSLTYGKNTLENINGGLTSTGFGTNTQYKLFAGYNSAVWAISAVYINGDLHIDSDEANRSTQISTGNVRLNFVYRFEPGEKTKKILGVLDIFKKPK